MLKGEGFHHERDQQDDGKHEQGQPIDCKCKDDARPIYREDREVSYRYRPVRPHGRAEMRECREHKRRRERDEGGGKCQPCHLILASARLKRQQEKGKRRQSGNQDHPTGVCRNDFRIGHLT